MSNVYYDSPDFGLQTIGEIDWSDGCYNFDLTVVWCRTADGAFLTADDAGCSCPSPFEDKGINDLTEVGSLAEFQAKLLERSADNYNGDRETAIAELVERMHKAGARCCPAPARAAPSPPFASRRKGWSTSTSAPWTRV